MKRGTWWPIGITSILAATVGANIWVMTIANDDPSFAIEHDYYRQAVTWDSTIARARESVRLGWRLTPELGPVTASGNRRLTARLTDAAGTPISAASITVSARHIARANDILDATLVPVGAGSYSAQLDARRNGQWELRFDVRVAASRYMETVRVEAYAAAGPP
jgi:nitrogen fixation protein FixH